MENKVLNGKTEGMMKKINREKAIKKIIATLPQDQVEYILSAYLDDETDDELRDRLTEERRG